MKEYIVKTTCYWGNRLYKKGEIVTMDDTVEVPEHFEEMAPAATAKTEAPKVEVKPKVEEIKKAETAAEAPKPAKKARKGRGA